MLCIIQSAGLGQAYDGVLGSAVQTEALSSFNAGRGGRIDGGGNTVQREQYREISKNISSGRT